jgi:hypothetical protein
MIRAGITRRTALSGLSAATALVAPEITGALGGPAPPSSSQRGQFF